MNLDPSRKNVKSYTLPRKDIAGLVPARTKTLLDVGCNVGSFGNHLKQTIKDIYIMGLDINPEAVQEAEKYLDLAYTVNLNDIEATSHLLSDKQFDVIVLADVLEHLVNPWQLMDRLVKHLNDDGCMIISIPNIGRWELIYQVLRQDFPLRERGVFDNTHLRFFMYNNLESLVPNQMYIDRLVRKYRLSDVHNFRGEHYLHQIVKYIPWFRELIVHQYVYIIRKV